MRLGKLVGEEKMVWTNTAAKGTNPGVQDRDQLLDLFIFPSSHSSIRATHLALTYYTLNLRFAQKHRGGWGEKPLPWRVVGRPFPHKGLNIIRLDLFLRHL